MFNMTSAFRLFSFQSHTTDSISWNPWEGSRWLIEFLRQSLKRDFARIDVAWNRNGWMIFSAHLIAYIFTDKMALSSVEKLSARVIINFFFVSFYDGTYLRYFLKSRHQQPWRNDWQILLLLWHVIILFEQFLAPLQVHTKCFQEKILKC